MLRTTYIERLIRQVYGSQPNDDSEITFNLVNAWINEGIGIAVKKNYTDSLQLDGIAYINNSFYSTFAGLAITQVLSGLVVIVASKTKSVHKPTGEQKLNFTGLPPVFTLYLVITLFPTILG